MNFEQIKINSKVYNVLKKIEYFDHGRWKPYNSAFLIENLENHKGPFTAVLIINKKGELETKVVKLLIEKGPMSIYEIGDQVNRKPRGHFRSKILSLERTNKIYSHKTGSTKFYSAK